jgi:hypothetical protein
VPLFDIYDTLRAELQANAQAQALYSQIMAATAPAGWAIIDDLLLFKIVSLCLTTQLYGPSSCAMLMRSGMRERKRPCTDCGHSFTMSTHTTSSMISIHLQLCGLLEEQNRAPAS